jgi:uncharacterized membrane protein
MLRKLKSFFWTSVLGGVIVILPMAILFGVFGWIFKFVTNLIQPLTNIIVTTAETRVLIAQIIVIGVILGACFFIGLFVRTRIGKFLFTLVENKLLKIAPGYTLVKETVLQFLGNKKAPYSHVVLAQIFGNDTYMTGFVTDESRDEIYTVFVPTGPNPTSGNIYHLRKEYVHLVDVSVEAAMQSIISCGAGSSKLIESLKQ